MKKILGLSGSLRESSFNTGLLRASTEVLRGEAELIVGSMAGVPLYHADEEAANGPPAAVTTLRRQLRESDGLLMATPEYNNGIPGVFKNAIDWMASGTGAEFFRGKPVAVMGASPMSHGTMLAQDAWWPVLRALGARPWFQGRLALGRARNLFDEDGNLTDPDSRKKLKAFVTGFVASL